MLKFLTKSRDLVAESDALPGRDEPIPVPDRHTVLGTPLLPPFPEGIEVVQLGLGCFWGAERLFWQLPGVYSTAVGYSGGYTKNPTYGEVCSGRTGHAEAVLVAYDPKVLPFEQLLRTFWEGHDPTQGMRQGNDMGTQYRSALYWTTDAQREVASARAMPIRPRCPSGAAARSRRSSRRPGRSTPPRSITSSTSRRTRAATAAWAARA